MSEFITYAEAQNLGRCLWDKVVPCLEHLRRDGRFTGVLTNYERSVGRVFAGLICKFGWFLPDYQAEEQIPSLAMWVLEGLDERERLRLSGQQQDEEPAQLQATLDGILGELSRLASAIGRPSANSDDAVEYITFTKAREMFREQFPYRNSLVRFLADHTEIRTQRDKRPQKVDLVGLAKALRPVLTDAECDAMMVAAEKRKAELISRTKRSCT